MALNRLRNFIKDQEKTFFQTAMTLSERIDLAYEVYQQIDSFSKSNELKMDEESIYSIQKSMQDFLTKALDVANVNQIHRAMRYKKKKNRVNPEYIPGKSTSLTSFIHPEQATTRAEFNWGKMLELLLSVKMGKMMIVNDEDRFDDEESEIKMLTAAERDAFRTEIVAGLFMVRDILNKDNPNTFKVCDTKEMTSHNKKGFVSFVINRNGEISIFNHFNTQDKIAHSSMNAGGPVLGAGEMEIVNGKLVTMTSYSGHYTPSVYNIFETLNFFIEKGLDVSEAQVQIFEKLPAYFKGTELNYEDLYTSASLKFSYPAIEILNRAEEIKQYATSPLISNADLTGDVISSQSSMDSADGFVEEEPERLSENPLYLKSDEKAEIKKQERSVRMKNLANLFVEQDEKLNTSHHQDVDPLVSPKKNP